MARVIGIRYEHPEPGAFKVMRIQNKRTTSGTNPLPKSSKRAFPVMRKVWQAFSNSNHHRHSFLFVLFLFAAAACQEQSDQCSGPVNRDLAKSIHGSWTPDPESLPDSLDLRGRTAALQSRIVFEDSGYRFYGKDRPVHRMLFSGLQKDDQKIQVFFRSSAGLCESMIVKILGKNQISIRIYSDYPILRYNREVTE